MKLIFDFDWYCTYFDWYSTAEWSLGFLNKNHCVPLSQFQMLHVIRSNNWELHCKNAYPMKCQNSSRGMQRDGSTHLQMKGIFIFSSTVQTKIILRCLQNLVAQGTSLPALELLLSGSVCRSGFFAKFGYISSLQTLICMFPLSTLQQRLELCICHVRCVGGGEGGDRLCCPCNRLHLRWCQAM